MCLEYNWKCLYETVKGKSRIVQYQLCKNMQSKSGRKHRQMPTVVTVGIRDYEIFLHFSNFMLYNFKMRAFSV